MQQQGWYTRIIFSVTSVKAALRFYCDKLDFTEAWRYQESEQPIVVQINNGSFELILAGNLSGAGQGKAFISLTDQEWLDLKKQIALREIEVEHVHWGYPTILICDPDGNALYFPDPASG